MLLEAFHLSQHVLWIYDRTRSHNTHACRIENATGNQVQFEVPIAIDNRVTCVSATLEAQTQVCICAQQVNEFALSLIAPLRADNDGY
jgi:hypothetical protein